jgi:raffinose/stachyose/melibiose transport system substrate-binding protein
LEGYVIMSVRLVNLATGSFLLLGLIAAPKMGANAAPARHDAQASVTVTDWWWAESDIPGADKWMRQTIALFEKAHPTIQIKLDIQGTDNLISNFQAAAAAHSGPDIATQWATIPVLSQAWAGAISPVSDYIPKSEIAHWANTAENAYAGKIWAMPLYLIGQPVAYNKALFTQAGLDPNKPPTTWAAFLADCAKLKAKGIIPFAMGNKDGYGGASFWSLFGKGGLNSADDVKRAVVGQTAFTDSRFTGWLTGLQTMMNDGYLNDDVASLDLNNGTNAFAQGKAGMTFSTDANIVSFAATLGEAKVGVFRAPPIGSGKLGSWYDATQSSSEMITSWSKHKSEAAMFLMFMHTPERLAAFYSQTGGFPADNRFKVSTVKDPLQKQMLAWDLLPNNIWLENFVPTQIDLNGDQIAGETVTAKSGGPDTAALLWDRTAKQWRVSNPAELQHFKAWIGAAL